MVLSNESPLKQSFDQFDIDNMELRFHQYKNLALNKPIIDNNLLLRQDIEWRQQHGQNFVASIEGIQGSGKSMTFSSLGLFLGKTFNVPFTHENIFFSLEKLNDYLEHAKHGETVMYDEQRKANVGLMSLMQQQNLSDFEDQLRKKQNNLLFASPELREHSHFFVFESKHIVWNDEGTYPEKFLAMLKTPRYTNKNDFVWRGFVSFPMPPKEFLVFYDAKKDAHLANLKKRKGSTIDSVEDKAFELFEKRESDLIRETGKGFIVPLQEENMMFVVNEEIGSMRFTLKGYRLLMAKIRVLIEEKYREKNDERNIELEHLKQELDEQKRQKQEFEEKERKEKWREKARLKELELKAKEQERLLKLKELELKLKLKNKNLPVEKE